MSPRDYFAYGLHVRSPVLLPFASLCMRSPAASVDVTVRFGAVPAALRSIHRREGFPEWEVAPGVFLFRRLGVAHYLVTEGREILVQPLGRDDCEIGRALAGVVWWALLLQRGIVPLHGSAVAFEEGAGLFLGRSGVGKSSLLGALLRRGHAMLADETVGVAPGCSIRGASASRLPAPSSDSRIQALPCLRPQLHAVTLNALRWRKPPMNEQSYKHLAPVWRFHTSPLPIHALYLLDVHDRNGIEVETVRGISAIEMLRRQVRFDEGIGRVTKGLAWQKEFLQIMFAMAKQAPVVRVTRSAHSFQIDALACRIEEHLREVARDAPCRGVGIIGDEPDSVPANTTAERTAAGDRSSTARTHRPAGPGAQHADRR